jgi:hypothetical protein
MEIPEIQYQPGQVSSNVAPVEQVDVTQSLRENQARTANEMQANLAQMQRNAGIQLQNVKDQAFPVEELARFSQTAANIMDEKAESMKADLEAEMTMLAYQDGVPANKEFDAQEKELEEGYKELNNRANKYQAETGDAEGAERIRNLSGWKKYYYNKAQAEQAGKGFAAFLSENSTRQVPVNGKMVTLMSATAEERSAVVAYLSSEYMQPFQGMNKSFLGKYLFPGMQKGQTAVLASITAERNKTIKANQLDEAKTNLLSATDKGPAMLQYRDMRIGQNATDSQIRSELVAISSQFKTKAELDSFLDSPYGPNGKTFREQYPKEAQEATDGFFTLQGAIASNNAKARQIADTKALEEAMAAVANDTADGSFDADPEKLKLFQEQAEAAGHKKTAEYWKSQIAETAYMKNSEDLKKQYEMQIAAGVIPQESEILQNPALSQEHKQALLSKATDSGKAEPTAGISKTHKEEIKDYIKKRGGFLPMQANDPSIGAMEHQAWTKYTQDYNAELKRNGGDTNAAAIFARNEFLKEFNKKDGEYRVITSEDVAKDKKLKPFLGTYAEYDRFGETAVPKSPMQEIRAKTQGPNAFMSIQEALEAPDLYYGEDTQLEALQKSFTTEGKIGTIPPVYYELQQQLGGKMSIMDLLNKRLEANGMDQLPEELNNIIKPVEETFDEDSYRYINYKPNPTRTDIGLINSGVPPIYAGKVPAAVANDEEFQAAVTDTAGRLGIPEEHLYAAMSFETGGTFNPAESNKMGSGATGLIQFMPRTAEGLGTSTEELASMSRSRQMHYVEKYLSNKGIGPGSSLDDIYMAILFPAAVGKSNDYVLFGQGAMSGYTGRAYDQNRGLDKNGDGSITKKEAAQKVIDHRNSMSPWRQPINVRPGL